LSWIALHALFFFSRDALDYFSIGALNEKSVDSNLGVAAAWEQILLFFRVFFLVFSLEIIFSSFLFS
jgi:hypothetical protein